MDAVFLSPEFSPNQNRPRSRLISITVTRRRGVGKNVRNLRKDGQEADCADTGGGARGADGGPVEMREVLIPAEFDDVYLRYNEVQRAQGMDLAPYAGKTCSQWIYRVTNYPSEEEVRAALLVLDGKIIGGDLSSTALGGFLCGFGGEGLETPWSLPQESAAESESPAGEAAESAPPESESPASGDAAAAEAAGTEIIPDDAWPVD